MNQKLNKAYIKKIFGIMSRERATKATLFLYAAISLASGFLIVYSNSLLRTVFDNLLMFSDFNRFVLQLLLVTAMFISVFGMSILNIFILQRFVQQGTLRLIEFYLNNIVRAKYSFFSKKESAEIWSDLSIAAQGSAGFFGELTQLVSTVTIFVFYGAVVFGIDIYAGILTVAFMPIYFLLTRSVGKNFMNIQQATMDQYGDMSTAAQEALENIANMKTKNAYEFFTGRITGIQSKISKNKQKFIVIYQYVTSISGLIAIVAPLLIIFGAMQFSAALLENMGNVMVLYINIPLFLNNFSKIYTTYINYKSEKPALLKLREFDEIDLETGGTTVLSDFLCLETKGVKVKFEGGGEITVPDFTVKKGEKVMLFGESGVGKSTIFNILMGLNQNYEGQVTINGANLHEIDILSLRNIFGIVFQQTNVLTLTLEENMLLGLKEAQPALDYFTKIVSLESQTENKANQLLNNKMLSGGEKSRLGLSQMLVRQPEIMLIDEAFSNMDEELESLILGNIFEAYPDKTVICVSHRSTSKDFFDRVVQF